MPRPSTSPWSVHVKFRLLIAMLLFAAVLSPAASAADPPPDGAIAVGVSIDGVPVGGLTELDARKAVLATSIAPRIAPLVLNLRGRRMSIKPRAAGYSWDLDTAIATAMTYGRTAPVIGLVDLPLNHRVDRAKLKALLKYRAKGVEVTPVDALLYFKKQRPRVRKPRIGTRIDIVKAVPVVADAMLERGAPEVSIPALRIKPAKMTVGTSIVINRGNRVLTLYREEKRVKTFRVAVGTPSHPTPRGRFSIIQMQKNPTWIPPDSPWAKGLGPIPPGPGNPLGTRWMGTSASAVGIHGTNAPGSIGTAASHGCIRMYVRDSEWLYNRIKLGTAVLIV